MATDRTTSIKVSEEVWQELNGKKRLGDSFDDVLRRELGLDDDRDDDPVADLDLAESKADAVRAMYEFVKAQGETTPKSLKAEIFDEYPATYEGSGPDYWHRQLAEYLEQLPGIERPSQRRWVFDG